MSVVEVHPSLPLIELNPNLITEGRSVVVHDNGSAALCGILKFICLLPMFITQYNEF